MKEKAESTKLVEEFGKQTRAAEQLFIKKMKKRGWTPLAAKAAPFTDGRIHFWQSQSKHKKMIDHKVAFMIHRITHVMPSHEVDENAIQ